MTDRNLSKLVNRFITNAVLLEQKFELSDPQTRAFTIISLYADWEEFSRRLVYSSAALKPLAANGRRIMRAPGIRTKEDVDLAIKNWKRARPSSRLVLHLGAPRAMADICKALRLSNERVILPAILSQHSPADELRLVRNFLAHQNESTASQLPRGPKSGDLEVTALTAWLAENQPGNRSRFGVWASDLASVARACSN